jgi:hypothetical protein
LKKESTKKEPQKSNLKARKRIQSKTMNTEIKIDVESTHNLNLPGPFPPALQRQVNVYDPRPRVGKEKHYLQLATMHLDGNLVETGYTMVKSYETFSLIMLCNNAKVYPHAYKRWDWYGKDHYETDEYEVIDLATGNVLQHWGYNEETNQLYIANQEPRPYDKNQCKMCNRKETALCQTMECVVIVEPQKNDLSKCAYSEEMYNRLMKISEQNEAPDLKEMKTRHKVHKNPIPDRTELSPEVSKRIDQEIRELINNVRQRK